MHSIQFQKVGGHDYFEKVLINPEGEFKVEKFAYSDEVSRSGKLCDQRLGELDTLICNLPSSFNNINGDKKFASQLLITSENCQQEYWVRPGTEDSGEVGRLVDFIRDL